MKICLHSDFVHGFPYAVEIPDPEDPTETIIEVPDNVAQEWLDMQQKYDKWQKEIDLFLEKTGHFRRLILGTYDKIKCKIDFIVSKPEPQKDPNEPNRKVPPKLGEWKGTAAFASLVDFNKARSSKQKVEVKGTYLGVDVFGDAVPTAFNEIKMTIEFVGSGALYGIPTEG
ncbi:MAG: hypothetical protein IMF10_09275 [Proteobacteria bacterium]|nr:hypothetical protein [Pseudomonadota bacterium]